MGNSTSNAANPINASSLRLDSPTRRTNSPIRGGSPVPSSHRVHKSLRTKKKSLELPDLASLALTPTSSSPSSVSPHAAYRRPRASSPIPIPTSANPPQQTFRPQNNLPSAAHIQLRAVSSTQGRRQVSYLDSAYPSTHSFDQPDQHSPPQQTPRPPFVQEIIHSTLPLAIKQESDVVKPEPITVTIKWRCGGKNVVLARAGDDNWKGRQVMDYDPNTNTWTTPVSLLPGTHHFKFIVDDQWRIADDYSTAVDDRDGSLANYVNVTLPSSSSPQTPAHPSPITSPHHTQSHQLSFWSDSTATTGGTKRGGVSPGPNGHSKEADWTTVIPPELIQAAAEEENYLASADSPTSSSSVPAPNIPPAPLLPRHLDKLILNVRPATVTGAVPGSGSSNGSATGEKDKARKGGSRYHRRDRDRDNRARPTSSLGMTATPAETNATLAGTGSPNKAALSEGTQVPPSLVLPVVTASGTDVAGLSGPPTPSFVDSPSDTSGMSTPSVPARSRKVTVASLGGPGMADDASVLPVPSHVVLHHLSTSAIRNGVLAVASTTRYRKKYITTIYYKPT